LAKKLKLRETTAPYQELIGWEYSEAEEGRSECAVEVREALLNSRQALASVHGGAIYSLADGAMGGALYSALNENEWGTTVQMNIVYLKAVTSGRLSCTARIVDRRESLATLEAEVRCEDQVIAKAIGTWYISRR